MVLSPLTDKVLHDILKESLGEAIRDSVDATLASIVYTGRCFRRLGSPPCSWCSISSRRPTQPVAAEEPATITFTLNAPSPPHAHRLGLVLIRQGYDRVRGCHTLVVVKVWDRPCPLRPPTRRRSSARKPSARRPTSCSAAARSSTSVASRDREAAYARPAGSRLASAACGRLPALARAGESYGV